jgi:cytochrome c oxidase subunit 3
MTDEFFGTASDGKIGMWIFLLADAMSFAGLLLGYGILRAGQPVWPLPSDHLGIPLTAALTFLLICSSVTMVFAVQAAMADNKRRTLQFLGLTILGGIGFLCGQYVEYAELIHEGITLSACAPVGCPSQFASTFFVVTGFHGLHVFSGVVYMICIFVATARGKYEGGHYDKIEILGLFWHFVDLVWILVFTFVYLL